MGKFKRRNYPFNSNLANFPMPKDNDQLIGLASNLIGRANLMARMGKSFGTSRDIYEALGYTKTPTFDDYWARYERQDIAKRIVCAPVSATWREKPEVTENKETETAFEKEWKLMVKELNVFHYLSRVDRISGIGEYGALVLGFDDGADLIDPLESAKELLFLQPYSQNNADISTWVKDTTDPRFGLPETYKIDFSTADKSGLQSQEVHHSRIIHVAEGLFENDVYGEPRLRAVLNRLQDLDLVSGGSAEMFWRGAFPGYGFKNDADSTIEGQALIDLQDEIEEYMHGLKRYIRLQNISVEDLTQQVASPEKHADLLVSLISSATSIPKRLLLGSERGELASTQDKENWSDRIDERRRDHAEPIILRPFIDKCVEYKILPAPGDDGYEISWPEIYSPTDAEQAEVAERRTQTLAAYVNAMGADLVVPPEMFLKKFMGFTDDEVAQAVEATEKLKADEEAEIEAERKLLEESGGVAPGAQPGTIAPL